MSWGRIRKFIQNTFYFIKWFAIKCFKFLNAYQSQKWLYFVYQKLIIPDDTDILAIQLKIDKNIQS